MIVDILRLDNFGRGICFIEDKICFVKDAYPEEKVKIEIINETKKYLEAKQIEVLEKSKYRIESKCPYYKECGGCNFQTLSFEEENKYKEEKVKFLVKKVLGLNESVVKSISYKDEFNYRNKVTLHNEKSTLGLYKNNTHEIVEIKSCLLLSNKLNEMIPILKEYKEVTEALLRTSNDEKELLISLKTNSNSSNYEKLKVKCNCLIVNDNLQKNTESIKTNIDDKDYYLSANSFFQINKDLTKDLYDEVLKNVKENTNKNVLDLYCGTGSIGIYVNKYCDKVIGIDYNESNINDANNNKKLNNINNIEFICDKVENKIDSFKGIDTIIVDPPRSGLDNKTKKYLLEIKSKTIIYVSCDLNTLIRDIKELMDNYTVEYIKPFNMFPRTYHTECVCVLNLRKLL